MRPIIHSVILCFAVLFLFSSCSDKDCVHSRKPEVVTRLFDVSPEAILGSNCQIYLLSKDSFFSPPVIDPYYKIVGVVNLDEEYQVTNRGDMKVKKMEIPSSLPVAPVTDWQTCPEWSQQLMKEGVKGEIYYSPSWHALYFEVSSYLD